MAMKTVRAIGKEYCVLHCPDMALEIGCIILSRGSEKDSVEGACGKDKGDLKDVLWQRGMYHGLKMSPRSGVLKT